MMQTLTQQIKQKAYELGFDACGICEAKNILEEEKIHFKTWLEKGYHAEMDYLAQNFEKRSDPTLLVEGARSIISLALNYFPRQVQANTAPQFAYYSYGADYHEVMKAKMQKLFEYIGLLIPETKGRSFCDTAPILERYWAAQAGLGFIGKNSLLIIPKMGSYFFLGELIINLELDFDKPLSMDCGKCSKCMDLCPTLALEQAKVLNSQKCISYQTIENRGNLSPYVASRLENRVYGCDICQQVCPWNRFAKPHTTPELDPTPDFLNLTTLAMAELSVEEYQRMFKGSAVKRAKYSGLKRNIFAIINEPQQKTKKM